MRLWLDAHLSPGIAAWINEAFDLQASSLRGVGLRDADDAEIFRRAKAENIIFLTKDADFVDLVEAHGAPPRVILLRCGNTTNARLREIFSVHLENAVERMRTGEIIVEIE